MQDERRLAWACRRGMLELDVLLGNFFKEAYPLLDAVDKTQFANLLTHTDPDLADWLMGNSVPEDAGLARIVELVRTHAKSRV
jgi:antitoxin CptB